MGSVGSFGPQAVLAGLLLATSFVTMFISNTATAVLFAPIALHAATSMGVSPYPYLIGVAVAASMCLASPFSTPPNAMVMSAGRYNFMDYIKVGVAFTVDISDYYDFCTAAFISILIIKCYIKLSLNAHVPHG